MRWIIQYPQGRCQTDPDGRHPEWVSITDVSAADLEDHTSRLAVHSRHFSFIPNEVFDPDDRDRYLIQLGLPEGVSTRSTPVDGWDGQLVYSLESVSSSGGLGTVESVWPTLLCLARALADHYPPEGLLVHMVPGQIYLVGYQADRLVFFNTFPVTDIHDHLYFILYGLEVWGRSPVHQPVWLSGWVAMESPLFRLLDGYLGQVSLLSPEILPGADPEGDPADVRYLDLRSFAMCASSAEN